MYRKRIAYVLLSNSLEPTPNRLQMNRTESSRKCDLALIHRKPMEPTGSNYPPRWGPIIPLEQYTRFEMEPTWARAAAFGSSDPLHPVSNQRINQQRTKLAQTVADAVMNEPIGRAIEPQL